MNVKQLVGTILDTVIKIVIIAVVVTYTYRYAVQVYEVLQGSYKLAETITMWSMPNISREL